MSVKKWHLTHVDIIWCFFLTLWSLIACFLTMNIAWHYCGYFCYITFDHLVNKTSLMLYQNPA